MRGEFELRDVDKTMETMVDNPYNTHVPVMTGGVGGDGVREFYTRWFIPQNPPDTEITLVSRTIGDNRLVDELIQKFTHTIQMDWMLPGIPPTGKRVELPVVVIVGFRDGKIAYEHIYWDQASVLAQIGLLDASTLPVVGVESARKVLDPSLPSNTLIERASQRK
jgi:carboxymethylenebutenolidase